MPERESSVATKPSLLVLFPSSIGPLGLELRGQKIVHLTIGPSGKEKKRFTPFEDLFDEVEDADLLDEIFGRLSEYFAGARKNLDLEWDLAPAGLPRMDAKILQEVAKIPYGRTRTYQRIANAVGHPEGYRQVLATLVNNPIPIVIPCHRVVTNKSGVGSYIGGKETKKRLLELEKKHLEDAS
jgi:methylated-DNA-[protein]-cysteine S-methyltransferase